MSFATAFVLGLAIGLPQASAYLSTLSNFLETEPLVAVIPSIAAIAVILSTSFREEGTDTWRISWRTVLPVFGLQLISYLAVAKQTELCYLIPLSTSLGLSLVLLFFYASPTRRSAIGRAIGYLTLGGLLFLGFKDFIEWAPATYAELRAETADQLRLHKHAVEITKNDIRVDYFFSDSLEYPLCNGDAMADNAFGPFLEKLYPNRLFFDVYGHRFQTFAEYIDLQDVLREHDHLYFLGSSEFLPKMDGFDPQRWRRLIKPVAIVCKNGRESNAAASSGTCSPARRPSVFTRGHVLVSSPYVKEAVSLLSLATSGLHKLHFLL